MHEYQHLVNLFLVIGNLLPQSDLEFKYLLPLNYLFFKKEM